jgi:hypothetical protein
MVKIDEMTAMTSGCFSAAADWEKGVVETGVVETGVVETGVVETDWSSSHGYSTGQGTQDPMLRW